MTESPSPEFREWPKTLRLSKTSVLITEKIDGTNAAVVVTEDGRVHAQSRKRLITPGKSTDNAGFAAWVEEHSEELTRLGPGYHYGEWWGLGIQRGYDQDHKRFSLFDADRYGRFEMPACVEIVPVLYRGEATALGVGVKRVLQDLRVVGSWAAPGFMRPEGLCVVHDRRTYKVLLENDDLHKSQVAA